MMEWFLKVMGSYDDMCLIFAGNCIDGNLITVFYDDFDELMTTASSLIGAGAIVVIGKTGD